MATNKMAMYYHMQMFLCVWGKTIGQSKCFILVLMHIDLDLREFLSLHPYTKSKMAAT